MIVFFDFCFEEEGKAREVLSRREVLGVCRFRVKAIVRFRGLEAWFFLVFGVFFLYKKLVFGRKRVGYCFVDSFGVYE